MNYETDLNYIQCVRNKGNIKRKHWFHLKEKLRFTSLCLKWPK